MAYGDGLPPEELEYTELLFRCGDLIEEWFRAFREQTWAPDGDDAAERLAVEWTEQRLEEATMDLSLHLKARRLGGRGGAGRRSRRGGRREELGGAAYLVGLMRADRDVA